MRIFDRNAHRTTDDDATDVQLIMMTFSKNFNLLLRVSVTCLNPFEVELVFTVAYVVTPHFILSEENLKLQGGMQPKTISHYFLPH